MRDGSRTCSSKLPLFPEACNLRQWWEEFWQTQPSRFGDASPSLLRLVDSVPSRKPSRAIDIGSGNGRYAIELARMGFDADALEWTTAGINQIRRGAATARTTVACLPICFLKVASETRSYDLVLSSGLLEEIPREAQALALRGYANWTGAGGQLVLRYCTEIVGRGPLVSNRLVQSVLMSSGMEIYYFSEDSKLKRGRSGLELRAATVAARKL